MSNELLIEYIYETLLFADLNNRNIISVFNGLFKNDEFLKMIDGKPFDEEKIHLFIQKSSLSKRKLDIKDYEIRYLAFLTMQTIQKTYIKKNKIPKYINLKKNISLLMKFHTQDVDDVIFQLMSEYNERYCLRKTSEMYFLEEDTLFDRFQMLYPFKRFDNFKLFFDSPLFLPLYIYKNEILMYSSDLISLLDNPYFFQRYCVGYKIYCFCNLEQDISPKFPLYRFIINETNLTLIEPNGLRKIFKYSN